MHIIILNLFKTIIIEKSKFNKSPHISLISVFIVRVYYLSVQLTGEIRSIFILAEYHVMLLSRILGFINRYTTEVLCERSRTYAHAYSVTEEISHK